MNDRDTEPNGRHSRRRFVVTGVGTVAAVLAGCLDRGTEGGEPAPTAPEALRTWVPAAVAGDEFRGDAITPARVADRTEFEPGEIPGTSFDGLSTDVTGAELVVRFRDSTDPGTETVTVFQGSVDTDDVLEQFEAEELLTADGSIDITEPYAGYEIHESDGGGRALGLSGDTAVLAPGREELERTVDANRGATARLLETDRELGAAVSNTGTEDFVSVARTEGFGDSALAIGTTARADRSPFDLTLAPAEQAPRELGERLLTSAEQRDLDTPELSTTDRTATVSVLIRTDDLFALESVDGFVEDGERLLGGGRVPNINFEYERDAGTVTVRMRSGDIVGATNLRLEGSGFEGAGRTWAALDGDLDPNERVLAGETLALDARADARIDIVWSNTGAEDTTTAVISSFEG